MNKKFYIKITISIFFVGYLLWSININDLYSSFKNANVLIMILAVLLTIPQAYLISTLKWKILLNAQSIQKPRFLRLWALYYIGSFFSNFLPTEVGGDLIRVYEVGKISGKLVESLAAVVMERITGFSAIIMLGVMGLLFNLSISNKLRLTYVILGAFAGLVAALILLSQKGLTKWIRGKLSYKSFHKVFEKLESFYSTLSLYKGDPSVLVLAMVISFFFQLMPILFLYGLLISLKIELPFLSLILIVPTVSLLGVVPISINGIGLREGVFVYIFTHMGISFSQSFALAFLFRMGCVAVSLVGGVLYILLNITDYKILRQSLSLKI